MEHIDPAKAKLLDGIRAGKPCSYCQDFDPSFSTRPALDQLVSGINHSANAHVTEDGYVRHRMVELGQLTQRRAKTAAA
jgi:hypothetical protein